MVLTKMKVVKHSAQEVLAKVSMDLGYGGGRGRFLI